MQGVTKRYTTPRGEGAGKHEAGMELPERS
jgi:hypothetical protein